MSNKVTQFYKFPKIVNPRSFKKQHSDILNKGVVASLTEKIHGGYVGIGIEIDNGNVGDKIIPQSRNNIIEEGSKDTYGAYDFIMEREDRFKTLAEYMTTAMRDELVDKKITTMIMAGEFGGKGIQKHSALSGVDRKIILFQFAIFLDGDGEAYTVRYSDFKLEGMLEVEEDLQAGDILFVESIVGTQTIRAHIDGRHADLVMEDARLFVKKFEDDSPFGNRMGVKGNKLEGVILLMWERYRRRGLNPYPYIVKVKSERFTVGSKVKTKTKIVLTDKEEELLKLCLDDSRFEQAIQELFVSKGKPLEDILPADMPTYFKWINEDIAVELKDLIEDSTVDYKNIKRSVSRSAKEYFLKRIGEI